MNTAPNREASFTDNLKLSQINPVIVPYVLTDPIIIPYANVKITKFVSLAAFLILSQRFPVTSTVVEEGGVGGFSLNKIMSMSRIIVPGIACQIKL